MTSPVAGVPSLNPITAQIPSYALQQLQAQRRMQMAQALTEQGLAPIDYDPKGHISWTQGLAKMLAAGLGGVAFSRAAKQQAALQTQGMQAMGQAYGMNQQPPASGQPSPQALAAALDPRASAALAQGAQQGSIGPTVGNAARMDAMPQPAAPAQLEQQPQGGGAPLNPMGLPPMLLWQASQGDPAAQEQIKTLLANRTLTPEQRNAQDPTIGASVRSNLQTQNMTPLQKLQAQRAQAPDGSVQARQLDDAISKETYIAPIDAKPGTPVLDPRTLQPKFFAPKVGDGIGLDFTNPLAPTAAAIPGYAGASASIVGPEQRARVDNSIQTATGPNGAPITGYGSDVFAGATPPAAPASSTRIPPAVQAARDTDRLAILQQERAKPGNTPADNAALDREIARAGGGAQPAPRQAATISGPSATDAAVQKSGADAIGGAPAQLAASKQAITGLESALSALKDVRATGPGTLNAAHVNALLNNLGIPLGKSNTDNYQLLQKYLSNSLNAAANGSSAGGSDARFESFMHGQPNADSMDKVPLEGAIRYVLSQHDAAAARAQFLPQAYQAAKAAGDPNAALTAQQQWAQAYNPQVFAFSRMAPAERQAFKASLNPDQQAQFGAIYNAAHARGWVQ